MKIKGLFYFPSYPSSTSITGSVKAETELQSVTSDPFVVLQRSSTSNSLPSNHHAASMTDIVTSIQQEHLLATSSIFQSSNTFSHGTNACQSTKQAVANTTLASVKECSNAITDTLNSLTLTTGVFHPAITTNDMLITSDTTCANNCLTTTAFSVSTNIVTPCTFVPTCNTSVATGCNASASSLFQQRPLVIASPFPFQVGDGLTNNSSMAPINLVRIGQPRYIIIHESLMNPSSGFQTITIPPTSSQHSPVDKYFTPAVSNEEPAFPTSNVLPLATKPLQEISWLVQLS